MYKYRLCTAMCAFGQIANQHTIVTVQSFDLTTIGVKHVTEILNIKPSLVFKIQIFFQLPNTNETFHEGGHQSFFNLSYPGVSTQEKICGNILNSLKTGLISNFMVFRQGAPHPDRHRLHCNSAETSRYK